MAKIKKGDTVEVISGNDRTMQGVVQRVLTKSDRVVIAGVNKVKKHQRPMRAGRTQVQPGIIDGSMGKIMGDLAPDHEAVLATFINVANSVPEDTALVLNDYHLIKEPSIHHALTFLIDHLPASFHITLATRGEPPLPFARYRARGELQELGADHPVFKEPYPFPQGLPKIHEHDGKRPQALGYFSEGRLMLLFTFESDLGDGWEDPAVHNDPEEVREKALRMGANILYYAFNN